MLNEPGSPSKPSKKPEALRWRSLFGGGCGFAVTVVCLCGFVCVCVAFVCGLFVPGIGGFLWVRLVAFRASIDSDSE